jgi:FkbM family methyltransferase
MKTIIEIGANDGNDTFNFVSQPDTFLYTFEPVPILGDWLVQRLNERGYTNYKLLRYAVSDTEGLQQFNLSDAGGNFACSSLNEFTDDIKDKWPGRADFRKVSSIDVRTIRMDTFIEQEGIKEIDYFHCDAQGNDFKILQSFGKYLDKIKEGRVEAANRVNLYKADNNVYTIIKWLMVNGFEVTEVKDHHGVPVEIEYLKNSTEEVDIFFKRKEETLPFTHSLNIQLPDNAIF